MVHLSNYIKIFPFFKRIENRITTNTSKTFIYFIVLLFVNEDESFILPNTVFLLRKYLFFQTVGVYFTNSANNPVFFFSDNVRSLKMFRTLKCEFILQFMCVVRLVYSENG